MADKTGIEWTDASWNPIRGCSRVSEGCRHCYAERVAARFDGPGKPYEGLIKRVGDEPRWNGQVMFVDKMLDQPLRWRKPRRVFVNSMSDLFHESVPDEWIDQIFAVMALAPQHTFQILTKRPERMRRYLAGPWSGDAVAARIADATWRLAPTSEKLPDPSVLVETPIGPCDAAGVPEFGFRRFLRLDRWPLPNVWLGVSVENQAAADERIPLLLKTPAATRFISAEPLLGPIDLTEITVDCSKFLGCTIDWITDVLAGPPDCQEGERLDWVIVGGESGGGARPLRTEWVRSLRDQCVGAGVPFFFKQWGEFHVAEECHDTGGRFWRFQDGGEFHINSDGEDILLGAAETEIGAPSKLWWHYWATGDGHLAKRPGKKRAGSTLDGQEWREFPDTQPPGAAAEAQKTSVH